MASPSGTTASCTAFGNGTYTYAANGASYTYTPGLVPDNYPGPVGLQPGGYIAPGAGGAAADFSKAGVSDVNFREFDTAYADSDAPSQIGSLYPKPVFGQYDEPSRFSEWNREFQLMLQQGHADNAGNPSSPVDEHVPQFMTVRLMHDHTQGVSSGNHTPAAEVADNDYGVAQLVQAVSQSPIWKSTAIFIVEDDAQDGPDHVDCHRSTAYVISPFIKQGSVDHTFYNTDSMLHTMELLMGLPPLSQYDAVATPILDFDTAPNNSAPFTPLMPSRLVTQTARIPEQAQPAVQACRDDAGHGLHPGGQGPGPAAEPGRLAERQGRRLRDARPAPLAHH